MKEIYLSYENGKLFKANIVRYFRFKNNIYLIYTLNEKDDRNYIKLYVVKVMKELGEFVTQTVRRQEEWNAMKGLVKRILGELKKEKLKTIIDLDYKEIEKVIIYESRNFLLASDLVELLAKDLTLVEQNNIIKSPIIINQPIEKTEEVESPILSEIYDQVYSNEEIEELEIENSDEEIEILNIDNEEIEELDIEEEFDDTEFLELEEKVEVLDI